VHTPALHFKRQKGKKREERRGKREGRGKEEEGEGREEGGKRKRVVGEGTREADYILASSPLNGTGQ
jgi:hypothetical protein